MKGELSHVYNKTEIGDFKIKGRAEYSLGDKILFGEFDVKVAGDNGEVKSHSFGVGVGGNLSLPKNNEIPSYGR